MNDFFARWGTAHFHQRTSFRNGKEWLKKMEQWLIRRRGSVEASKEFRKRQRNLRLRGEGL